MGSKYLNFQPVFNKLNHGTRQIATLSKKLSPFLQRTFYGRDLHSFTALYFSEFTPKIPLRALLTPDDENNAR